MNPLGLISVIVALAATASAGDGFSSLARTLDVGARRAGVGTVAVLPFIPVTRGTAGRGQILAERLTTALVHRGKISVAERTLLGRVLEERRLDQTGAISGMPEDGPLPAVEAVVTGTFSDSKDGAIVSARLVDLRSGTILAAAEHRVRMPSSTDDRGAFELGPAYWPSGPATDRVPLIEGNEAGTRRQTAECARAEERVDALQRAILELKARYWARRLQGGDTWEGLDRIPGSVISDEELRWMLYDRIRLHFQGPAVAPLSELDARLFQDADERSILIRQACRPRAPLPPTTARRFERAAR